MNSFVTGSHAYGTPNDQSDIDVVLLCSENDATIIAAALAEEDSDIEIYPGQHVQVKSGSINLLAISNPSEFEFWKTVTEELIAKKPVTRDAAVSHFADRRKQRDRELGLTKH